MLFLSQGGVDGDHQGVGVPAADAGGDGLQVQGVDRLAESAVNKDSVRRVRFELMADIGPETVSGGPVCADA